MLFVSQKEPLTSETLPDTSLHNVRSQAQQQQQDSHAENSAAFFHSPDACIPKLTKEQFALHREFLKLGSLLMAENVDLFHNALSLLSAKHNLKTVTPATSVSDVVQPSQIARHYSRAEAKDDSSTSKPSNRKYVLPKDAADKEFYQCMVCKERRSVNSFGSAHTHDGASRPSIRWYCPLCDSFFAVTHRGYHVKKVHSDVSVNVHSNSSTNAQQNQVSSSAEENDHVCLKRGREESTTYDDSESSSFSPAEKVQHSELGSPSTSSADSLESSMFAEEIDDMFGLFPSSFQEDIIPCQEEQDQLFAAPYYD